MRSISTANATDRSGVHGLLAWYCWSSWAVLLKQAEKGRCAGTARGAAWGNGPAACF